MPQCNPNIVPFERVDLILQIQSVKNHSCGWMLLIPMSVWEKINVFHYLPWHTSTATISLNSAWSASCHFSLGMTSGCPLLPHSENQDPKLYFPSALPTNHYIFIHWTSDAVVPPQLIAHIIFTYWCYRYVSWLCVIVSIHDWYFMFSWDNKYFNCPGQQGTKRFSILIINNAIIANSNTQGVVGPKYRSKI